MAININITSTKGILGVFAWAIGTIPLQPSGAFHLAATIPTGVPPNGTFAVDPTGDALPQGVTLVSDGTINVAANAPLTDPTKPLHIGFLYTLPVGA